MISVCMPVAGPAPWLPQALHSILMQGDSDVELVIQDKSSSRPELSPFENLLNISYESFPDRGIFYATNRALERAKGEILYFMCSDDLLCAGAFCTVREAFRKERFGGPYWVYGKTVSAHESGRALGIDGKPTTREDMLERNRIGQPSVFWNQNMLNLAGGFDVRYRYAADYDLWLRFWMIAEPEYLPHTLGVFRHHAEQATERNRLATESEAARISLRHREMAGIIGSARKSLFARKVRGGQAESVN